MKSDQILNELTAIYFRKCYFGFGEVTKEDEEYISQTFKLTPFLGAGYGSDKTYIENNLDLNKEYTLLDMNVSQSSGTLRLKEFPNKNFNTVNFIYRVDEQ